MMILTTYFALAENKAIRHFFDEYTPFSPTKMKHLTEAIRRSGNTVMLTNVVGGSVQAMIFCIGNFIAGGGNYFLIGFSVFLLSFIPIVGTAPVTAILIMNAVFTQNTGLALQWLIVGLIAGTSDNIVKPLVIRAGVQIHPFLGFITVLGGVILLGVPGLFIGPFLAGMFTTFIPVILDKGDPL